MLVNRMIMLSDENHSHLPHEETAGGGAAAAAARDFDDEGSTEGGGGGDREEEDVHTAPKAEETETWQTIAKKGNQAVSRSRGLLCLVLIATTLLVSLSIYRILRSDQVDDFARAFAAHANKVVESFHRSVERKMQAVDTLSVAMTSYAISTNQSFPLVTLPDFEIRSSGIRVLSESPLVNLCMLVNDKDRDDWEQYLLQQRAEYFNTTIARDAELREYQDSLFDLDSAERLPIPDIPFRDRITNLKMPEGTVENAPEGSGPYLPIWQVSPAVPWTTSYNFNLFSHPATAVSYREAILTGTAVMAVADNYQDASYGSMTDYFKLVYTHSQYRHQIGEDFKGGPTTGFAYPIFDSFDPETRTTVGIMSTAIYWRLNFANVLPPDARGVYCVLSNTFQQTMTFRIDGGEAIYLGPGDLHDAKYDHLEVATTLHGYLNSISSPETRAFTSVGLNSNHSRYYLKIYPSDDMEGLYRNQEPTIVLRVIIGIAVFITLIFLAYDFLVGQQHRFVMHRALASSAIVSSLFPAQVRESLYEEKQAETTESEILHHNAITRFINKNRGSEESSSKPIVARFESTTIFFADIAGFTNWSASRTPENVFVLLETLYQAFDEIAVRRRVFKVETIGDCYMAAAGLPEPQEQHAVIMAKFATDCLTRSREILKELTDKLGEDTSNLEMRIGIHSGAVTGGVLRGQKSRFQLFGDTVNTASRMESTGRAGCIHVSQSTAEELLHFNKAHWLIPRQDKVVAKGKGELSTFWLTVLHTARSELSSTNNQMLSMDSLVGTTEQPMANNL